MFFAVFPSEPCGRLAQGLRRWAIGRRQGGSKYERFRHIQVGQDLPVVVGAVARRGSVASVQLFYRAYGKKTWKTLTLSAAGDGLYGGTIPGAEIANNGLEYYVRATTTAGSTIQSANNASLPDVASAPYGDPAPGPYGTCGG